MEPEMTSVVPKRDFLLPASILIAGILIAGSVFYLVGSQKQVQQGNGGKNSQVATVSQAVPGDVMKINERDVVLGDPKAPVTIIEYGDYQCPFCSRFFSQTEPLIREHYIQTNKAKMIFRNFQFLGPESAAAGVAAECAKDQQKFWAYHDALYVAEEADGQENNGNLNRTLFMKLAGDLKMDTAAFGACIDSKKYDAAVADTSAAQSYGVDSTPTFFINGRVVKGAQPFEYAGAPNPQITPFKTVIDSFLK